MTNMATAPLKYTDTPQCTNKEGTCKQPKMLRRHCFMKLSRGILTQTDTVTVMVKAVLL